MKSEKAIYLKAAEQLATGRQHFTCNAVKNLGGDSARYREVMGFQRAVVLLNCGDDFLDAVNACASEYESRTNFRVLLLCMMAAACEDV